MGEIVVYVKVGRESKKYELSAGDRIIDLLGMTEFNPETVIVKRNGKIVVEEELLEGGDKLELIPVVSGG